VSNIVILLKPSFILNIVLRSHDLREPVVYGTSYIHPIMSHNILIEPTANYV